MKKYFKIMMYKCLIFSTLRIFYNRHCTQLLNNVLAINDSIDFGQKYMNKHNVNCKAIIAKLSIIEYPDFHNSIYPIYNKLKAKGIKLYYILN